MHHYEKHADKNMFLEKLGLNGKFHLLTLHRPEKYRSERKLREVMRYPRRHGANGCAGDLARASAHAGVIEKYKADGHELGALRLIEPLTYLQLLALVQHCDIVFTDSEAFHGKPHGAAGGALCCFAWTHCTICWIKTGATIGKTDRASIGRAIENVQPADAKCSARLFWRR